MVTEAGFRKFKGRLRILSRKCEIQKESVKKNVVGVFSFT